MPFGQLAIGPPGSGKSTYCYGLYQFLTALNRPVIIVNLDPAAPSPPYPSSISITSLITLQDAMTAYNLGPNGGMLYCLEYLDMNFDWLEDELENVLNQNGFGLGAGDGAGGQGKGKGKNREEAFVVFDTPGQVELSTDHGSLKNIVDKLQKKMGFRLAAVHLIDAHHITDASKYVALLLLSLRTMLQMGLPHINVLSKIDLLSGAGDLAFNLDFYTDVQDLAQLVPLLESDPRTARFSSLNKVICDLVEDFGLVSFETLCVEDKESMVHLVQVIDQALGYVAPLPPPTATSSASSDGEEDFEAHGEGDGKGQKDVGSHSHQRKHPHHTHSALPKPHISNLYHTSSVQEKWIDYEDEFREFERKRWEKEGDRVREEANAKSERDATKRTA